MSDLEMVYFLEVLGVVMAKPLLSLIIIYKLVQKKWSLPWWLLTIPENAVHNLTHHSIQFRFWLVQTWFFTRFFSYSFFPLFQKMPITRKSNLFDVVEMLPNWPEFHFYLTKSLDHDNHNRLGSQALVDLQSYKTTLLKPRTSILRRTVCWKAGACEIFSTTHNALQVWR